MSLDLTSRRAVLLAPLCLTACGFTPIFASGEGGAGLNGRLALNVPDTPDGYRFRTRIEDRLGRAVAPAATLSVELVTEETAAITEPDGTVRRSHLQGRAIWRLVSNAGATLAEGEERAFVGASDQQDRAMARTVNQDAGEMLMVLLADQIVSQLLLLVPEAQP